MGMRVPNVPEWQGQPGFEECECDCVRVAKKAWPDCVGCGGTGRIGVVPDTVYNWAVRQKAMPRYRSDPRFDPWEACRLREEKELAKKAQEWAASCERESRLVRTIGRALAALVVGALVTILVIEVLG